MRTTIRMNKELARRAKEYATKNQLSFTDVVEQAVSKLVGAPVQRRTRKIVLPTVGDPKRRITEAQYRAALDRMYQGDAESLRRGGR